MKNKLIEVYLADHAEEIIDYDLLNLLAEYYSQYSYNHKYCRSFIYPSFAKIYEVFMKAYRLARYRNTEKTPTPSTRNKYINFFTATEGRMS